MVHAPAPVGAVCAKCDESIPAGQMSVLVPGINRRGWAHTDCIPKR